jgi:hypothetical protein
MPALRRFSTFYYWKLVSRSSPGKFHLLAGRIDAEPFDLRDRDLDPALVAEHPGRLEDEPVSHQ